MVSTWCLELRSTSVGSRPSSGELGTPSRHDGLRVSSTNSGSLLQAGEDVNDRIEAIALGSQDEWKIAFSNRAPVVEVRELVSA